MKTPDSFYKTARWKHLREVILKRDGYMCQVSKRFGKHKQADTVHHIFPREDFPQYQWAAWNLISLSADVHNRMHDRTTNALTDEGIELLRRVAQRCGIDIPSRYADVARQESSMELNEVEKVLVCGYPGTGKTTYVKDNLGDGIAYDLDAIAAAFRLSEPHKERHEPSRRMANSLLYGFLRNAGEYSKMIYIIRSAPTIEEMEDISPTRVVMLLKRYVRKQEGYNTKMRLADIRQWCDDHGVPLQILT